MAARKRWRFWTGVIALLAAAFAYAFWPRPVEVDLSTVTRGDISVSVKEEGETRVRELYVAAAPISGAMERVVLQPGDAVVAGETKLTAIRPATSPLIDTRTRAQLQAAVEAARAAVAVAEAEVARTDTDHGLAQAELERAKPLLARELISRQRYDALAAAEQGLADALRAARAALKVRRSELMMAQAALEPSAPGSGEGCQCIDVLSPVDGVVLRVLRESEGPVLQGTAILEIGDPHEIEIVVDLLSEDAVAVNPGDAAEITGWGGPELEARVRRIEPFAFTKLSALGIDEQRVNVVLDLVAGQAAAERLGHGYRVDVAVITSRAEGVIVVPMTALFREGSDWAVFAVERGRARLKRIETGRMNTSQAEVLSGLSENETVIEHPSDRVRDGVSVASRRAG